MRKIIGFRIELRAHEILRRAKKAGLKLEDSGFDAARLEMLITMAIKSANPAVLFETFPPTDPDSSQLTSMPGLAYSIVLATLGTGFAAARAKTEAETPKSAPWWNIIQEAGLDEIFRFACALITDEAAKESCEISPLSKLSGSAVMERALNKIDSGKISISLNDGRLTPEPSSVASLSWLAKSTAKSRK